MLAFESYLAGMALIIIGQILDYADGTVARAIGSSSAWGRYLDGTSDKLVSTLMWITIAYLVSFSSLVALSSLQQSLYTAGALLVPILFLFRSHLKLRAKVYKCLGRKSSHEQIESTSNGRSSSDVVVCVKTVASKNTVKRIARRFARINSLVSEAWATLSMPLLLLIFIVESGLVWFIAFGLVVSVSQLVGEVGSVFAKYKKALVQISL